VPVPVLRTRRQLTHVPLRSRTGRKGPYAFYYLHCEPGNTFVGGGIYMPDSKQLQKLRDSIDERPRRWRRVLNNDRLKRTFLPQAVGKPGDEAVLKAYAEVNKKDALKTKPKASKNPGNTCSWDIGLEADRGNIEIGIYCRTSRHWTSQTTQLFLKERFPR
jgi:hypothetical protein